jgi:hypothetical protein
MLQQAAEQFVAAYEDGPHYVTELAGYFHEIFKEALDSEAEM